MQDICFDKPRICCDNCGKCPEGSCMEERVDEYEESIKDYDKFCDGMCCNNYFSKAERFLCSTCAQVKDDVIILDDENQLLEYFKLTEVFDNHKNNFAMKKLEPYKEEFKGKLTIDFIKKLNLPAYEKLINSKHFGIKKEKHRLAQEYVKQAKKCFINYLNVEMYNDDVMRILRKEILERQIDIICIKIQVRKPEKVYVQLKENMKFYEYSEKYTGYLEKACADGSNVGFSNDEYIIHELFDKMAEKMLKLDIWREKD